MHQALLFRQLSPAVTYFAHTAPAPAGEQAEQLAARDITVVPGPVAALEVAGDQLTGVRLAGNVADIAATVPGSAGAGTKAGAHINADLIAGETARAVAAAGPRTVDRPGGGPMYCRS